MLLKSEVMRRKPKYAIILFRVQNGSKDFQWCTSC